MKRSPRAPADPRTDGHRLFHSPLQTETPPGIRGIGRPSERGGRRRVFESGGNLAESLPGRRMILPIRPRLRKSGRPVSGTSQTSNSGGFCRNRKRPRDFFRFGFVHRFGFRYGNGSRPKRGDRRVGKTGSAGSGIFRIPARTRPAAYGTDHRDRMRSEDGFGESGKIRVISEPRLISSVIGLLSGLLREFSKKRAPVNYEKGYPMNAGETPRQKELFPSSPQQGQTKPAIAGSDFSVRQGQGDNWSVELIDKLVGAKSAHSIPSVN